MRALLDVNVLIALPIYVVALAVRRRGRFVSFDSSVPLTAIKGAEKRHIVTLRGRGDTARPDRSHPPRTA